MCGCARSPRNSICVVNALFKTINTHSGLYSIKQHELCGFMCVCDSALTWWEPWCGRVSMRERVCGLRGHPLIISLAAAVLKCSLGAEEASQNEKKRTHTPNSLSELTASFSSLHLGWTSIASMHLCNFVVMHTHTRTHTSSCMCTWTQHSSLPPPFASPCVWCGLRRTTFKETLLQLWSRSVFQTLLLLCFLFYLLTVCELGGNRASVEQDTWPTCSIYHVLYLWTWIVSQIEAIVSCKIRVYPQLLPNKKKMAVVFKYLKQMPREQSVDIVLGEFPNNLYRWSSIQSSLVCLDKMPSWLFAVQRHAHFICRQDFQLRSHT